MKIEIPNSQVMKFDEVVEVVARAYGWTKYKTDPKNGSVEYVGSDGQTHTTDTSDESVEWIELLDAWSNHVWAKDEDGNVVMIHD